MEELYYEYRDRIEREKAAQERSEEVVDKAEQDKIDEATKWAEEEEKKELEALAAKEKPGEFVPSEEDKKWMEEELRRAKEIYGESFGEDISEDFDGT